MDKAYETRRLFLKPKCKIFTSEKEYRDLDFDGLGEREVLNRIYDALVGKYHLGTDKQQNRLILSGYGYVMDRIYMAYSFARVWWLKLHSIMELVSV